MVDWKMSERDRVETIQSRGKDWAVFLFLCLVCSRCYIGTCVQLHLSVSVPETDECKTGRGGVVSLCRRHWSQGLNVWSSPPGAPTAENYGRKRHKPSLLQVIQSDDSSPDRHCRQLMDGCQTDGWTDGCSSSDWREGRRGERKSGSTQRENRVESPFLNWTHLSFLFLFQGAEGDKFPPSRRVSAQKATTCKHREELQDL